MFQVRIKPEIFVNFRPEPDPKKPARLATLIGMPFQNAVKFYSSEKLNAVAAMNS